MGSEQDTVAASKNDIAVRIVEHFVILIIFVFLCGVHTVMKVWLSTGARSLPPLTTPPNNVSDGVSEALWLIITHR